MLQQWCLNSLEESKPSKKAHHQRESQQSGMNKKKIPAEETNHILSWKKERQWEDKHRPNKVFIFIFDATLGHRVVKYNRAKTVKTVTAFKDPSSFGKQSRNNIPDKILL